MMKTTAISILVLIYFSFNSFAQTELQTTKPWTYWWWMGSAVDRANIDNELQYFSKTGLGGVHIIPIYGAKGYEDMFIPFLSEKWMEEVQYTIKKAHELNLGVDLTLGTGWPYGGAWIDESMSAKRIVIKDYVVENHSVLSIKDLSAKFNLDSIYAVFAKNGNDTVNLLKSGNGGIQPVKNYIGDTVVIVGLQPTMQKVKRAAPGGEGLVIDYFSEKSVNKYLNHFDSVFSNTQYPIALRAFYHDSYEVFGANSTPNLFEAFVNIHNYNLHDYLHVLTDTSHALYPYIIHDVRFVIDELLYAKFAKTWTQYCKNNKTLSRYQAHGSPANILDLYALSDIPETESFGCSNFDIPNLNCDPDYEEERFGRPSPLVMKFASSPAHLLNKPLVSSETATWLANHFKVSLRRVKPQVDELFTSGINHVFYHGTTYSPAEEGFPGWLFYASTNFGKTSHFSDEIALLNNYIENCQHLLQDAKPDNNILLYFPISDIWTKHKGNVLLNLDVHQYSNWFSSTTFGKTAHLLWDNGYCFDYISDRQISQLKTDKDENVFIAEISKYQTIVVPKIDFIPKATLDKLELLAQEGCEIIFLDKFPTHYCGLSAQKFDEQVTIDKNLILSNNLLTSLEKSNISHEELSNHGLDFIRKKNGKGNLYFITNLGDKTIEDTFRLASEYNFITVINPLTNVSEYIETQDRFYFKIIPGESFFIQTSLEQPNVSKMKTYVPYDTLKLNRQWTVNFAHAEELGIKEKYIVNSLTSWTSWGDEALKSFSGKAKYVYNLTMDDNSLSNNKKYVLLFDQIHESANVIVNGKSCGTIWSFPNQIELPANLFKKENTIEIIVQNLSANYMRTFDKQNPGWKKFYDINFVDITYKPFDASKWDLVSSGLMGDVNLVMYK